MYYYGFIWAWEGLLYSDVAQTAKLLVVYVKPKRIRICDANEVECN